MPKITKAQGPSDEITGQGMPLTDEEKAEGVRKVKSPADLLRERRKLGPYTDPETGARQVQLTPGHADPETGEATPATPTMDPPVRPTEIEREAAVASEEKDAVGKVTETEDGGHTLTTGEAETAPPEEPPRNASRDTWAAWVEEAHNVEVPEDMTRAELIEQYGTPHED